MLSGDVLYSGESVMKKLLAHRGAPIPSLSTVCAAVPAELENTFRKMVAKRPEDRQPSMTHVVAELESILRSLPSSPIAGSTEVTTDLKPSDFPSGLTSRSGKSPVAATAHKSLTKTTAATEITQEFSAGETSVGVGWDKAALAADVPPIAGVKHRVPRYILIAAALAALALAAGIVIFLPTGVDRPNPTAGGKPASSASPPAVDAGPTEQPNLIAAPAVAPPAATHALDFSPKLPLGYAHVLLPIQLKPREDLTVEMYVTSDSYTPVGDSRGIFSLSGGSIWLKQTADRWALIVSSKDTGEDEAMAPVTLHRRTYLAVVKTATEARLYIEGKLASRTAIRANLADSLKSCSIGGMPKDYANWTPFRGTIDELRITSAARYDSDFTPPAEFTADAQTAGLYHFDEGQGDTLNDSSGNNHHGNIVGAKWVRADGAATAAPAANDQALEFDGLRSRVEIPSLRYDGSHPLTIETWVRADEMPETGNSRQVAGWNGVFVLARGTRFGGYYSCMAFDPSGAYKRSYVPPFSEGSRLHHLAGVWDGRQLRCFVNGKGGQPDNLPDMRRAGENRGLLRDHFAIGCTIPISSSLNRSPTEFFKGQISEVHISKVARYEGDFTPQARFAADKDTLALYHFDEGQGDILNDSSGNHHHGKIVGAKWVRTDEAAPPPATTVASSETNLLTEQTIGAYTTRSPANFIRDPQGVIVADGVLVGKTWKPGETSIHTRVRSFTGIVGSAGRPSFWIGFSGPEKSGLNATFMGGQWVLQRLENWDDSSTIKELARQPAPYRFTGEREIEFRLHNRNLTLIDGGQVVAEATDVDFEPRATTIGTTNSQVLVTSWTSRKPEVQSAPAQQSPPKPALDFSAELARVEMPRVFNGSDHFTVEMFYTPLGPTGKNRLLFNSGGAFTLKLWGPNNISWHLANTDRINAPASLQVGSRTHLAGVSTGRSFSLFVQGRLIASAPLTGNLNANPSKGYLGSQAQALETWEPLNGLIDEFRYSKTARYSQSFVPPNQLKPDQDTLILYDFREGQGDTLTDSSGNNHHGKIVGAKWVRGD